MPTVLLIRHAQASFGTADYDVLSERGHEQVGALERALTARGVRPDRVVTGTLRRQADTARHWTQLAGDAAAVDPRWDEYDDGDLLSHHSAATARLQSAAGADSGPPMSSREFQVLLDEALSAWVAAGDASSCRQTWPAFLGRATAAFEDLAAGLGSGQTGAAFSSSGVIAALSAWLIGLPSEGFVALNRVTVNTGITKVVLGRQGRTLVTFNEHTHLEGDRGALVTYR